MFYLLVIILIYFVHLYLKQNHSIWRKQGIKGPAAIPILGNFASIVFLMETFTDYLWKVYRQYPDENVVGLFRGYEPMLLIKDPEIIKQILIKDFHVFPNRGLTPARGKINQNLVVANDETWKILRQNLTQVFTSKKLKDMFPLIQKSADNYVYSVQNLISERKEQEIKRLAENYTIQATTLCIFSVDTNPFCDKENEFFKATRMRLTLTLWTKLSVILDVIFPGIRKYIYTNLKGERYFRNLVNNIIKHKTQLGRKSKDVLDLLQNFQNEGKLRSREENGISEISLDYELLLAQMSVFYFAGVEPTAWLISYILHELALNQKIQDYLYEEICKVASKHNGEFTYDSINNMTYLDMVLNETLRKYPIATTVFRKCNMDYAVPGTKIVIPKDTAIVISIGALLNDPKYFTNPEVFDPENFSPENKQKIPQCVDMSFGDGPRNCIGRRFAILMAKIAIAEFIKKFKVSPSPKTRSHVDQEKFSLLYISKNGVWLNIEQR